MQRIAADERRAALLAAAQRVIGRDGIGRASTRAIAAEAGMPTASFHYVFESYDAMVERLVESVLSGQTAAVETAVGTATTLEAFIAGALDGWFERALTSPDSETVLHEVVHWSRSSPDRHHLAEMVYGRYTDAVSLIVHAAEQRFGVRWTVPSEQLARFVLVVTDGVAVRWLVDRDADAARRSLRVGAGALLGFVAEGER